MSGRLSTWVIGALCVAVCGLVPAGLASAAELPDGRGYEQVTPEEKPGGEVYPPVINPLPSSLYELEHESARSKNETELTFQAAADGSGIAYVEAPPSVGGNENQGELGGNEYLATRSPDGVWSQRVLSPENTPGANFQAFSSNLTTAVVDSPFPLSSMAPGFGEALEYYGGYDDLYSTSTVGGEYVPILSTKPPYREIESFRTAGSLKEPGHGINSHRISGRYLALEGASADYTRLLFAANDALTGVSEGRPAAEGGTSTEFEKEDNLYESVDGLLRLVNVLPNGTTHANATFGGSESFGHSQDTLGRVTSADGSRIFWTDLSTGHIYVRENGVSTVEISPTGKYQTASSDGSTVFYTNGDLYAYNVENGRATDLTPGVTVEKVWGASENGEYVYYETSSKELELWHSGASTQIAQVTPTEAEITPDGHSIVFQGEERPEFEHPVEHPDERVYTYDADSKTLYCASCGSHEATGNAEFSTLPMTNAENVYRPRWISADGAHVFFVSFDGLVPQDTNGIQDVYEWERPGTGGCSEAAGCIYLLSGGTSTSHSGFLDASESGEDVFIVTRANLVSGDEDGLYDVYDVRLGAYRAPVPPACSGTGCQGVPSPTPIFATPSSVTFGGVGNFAVPAKETKAKPKPKKKPKHKKKGKKRKSKAKKSARKADRRERSSSKGGLS